MRTRRRRTSPAEMERLRRESNGRSFVTPAGQVHQAENPDLGRGPSGKLLDGKTTFAQVARNADSGRKLAFALIAQQQLPDPDMLRELKNRRLHHATHGGATGRAYTLKDIAEWRNLLQQGRGHKGFGRPVDGFWLTAVSGEPRAEQSTGLGRESKSRTRAQDERPTSELEKILECATEEEARPAIHERARESGEPPDTTAAAILRELTATSAARRRVARIARSREKDEPLSSLLKVLYGGRCQVCGDTFETKSGAAYCEVHHLDADVRGVPRNLLVLCATCHVKMHHARVSGIEALWSKKGIVVNEAWCGVTVHEDHK